MQPPCTCPPAGLCCSVTPGSLTPSQTCTHYYLSFGSRLPASSVVSITKIYIYFYLPIVLCYIIAKASQVSVSFLNLCFITLLFIWVKCPWVCVVLSCSLPPPPPWSPLATEAEPEPQSSVLLSRQMTPLLLCLLQEPCVSYSWFIYSLGSATGISTLIWAQLAFRLMYLNKS